jgi:ERCC4-type nuclease
MRNLKIIVDQRERNAEILDELEDRGFSIKTRTLPSGDYILSDRVAVERKTIADFERSILNGRLFEQARDLKENYALPMIILEGDQADLRLSRNVIIGAMVALYADYGVEMLVSDDAKGTAEILTVIARHEQQGRLRANSPSVKGGRAYTLRDFQRFVMGNLPGIGPKLSDSLLRHFGSIKKIANASVEELMEVEKIGKKKAALIHTTINEDYTRGGELYLKP